MLTLTLTLSPEDAALIYRAAALHQHGYLDAEQPLDCDPGRVAAVLVELCRERVERYERG